MFWNFLLFPVTRQMIPVTRQNRFFSKSARKAFIKFYYNVSYIPKVVIIISPIMSVHTLSVNTQKIGHKSVKYVISQKQFHYHFGEM